MAVQHIFNNNYYFPLFALIMASDDDYLSDLTDIESDYTESKGKKPVTKSAWRVRKALTPARATTYSAQALYGMRPTYFRQLNKSGFNSS